MQPRADRERVFSTHIRRFEISSLQQTAMYLRQQIETGVDQAKSWQDAVRKVSEDVSKPGKTIVEKTVQEAKVG